jgi:hypothetical protein
MLASNTISQGDTRQTGLTALLADGAIIYDAIRSMLWTDLTASGEANVAVSVLHLAKGSIVELVGNAHLDGVTVQVINSRLRAQPERNQPATLQANSAKCYLGSKIYGQGFVLTPEERDALVKRRSSNLQRILPYIGGEEINTSPTQAFDRYVITFGQMTLEEAERWPELLKIVRERVKPERDTNNRDVRRKYWWRFGEVAPALYKTIAPLKRCLANSRHTKHLVFAFQSVNLMFSEAVNVFAFEDYAHFAVLQSRIHEPWARLLSSTLEDRLRYAASDCFETFPFPRDETLTRTSAVEHAGKALNEARARYMGSTNQGLTQTYNRLKDPTCMDALIVDLRGLHGDMDRAVLDAYGWGDLKVPAYGTPTTAEERRAAERFEDEVIDRLFALNAERAEEERHAGLATNPGRADSHSAKARTVPHPAASEVRVGRKPSPIGSDPPPAQPGLARATPTRKTATRAGRKAS